MSANFNPYVQGWRVGNGPSSTGHGHGEQPSIFGALPGTTGHSGHGGHAAAANAAARADTSATVYHIADFRPNVLNASVVDARGRQCYRIVTDAPQQPQRTVYYDSHRRTVALIDWAGGARPTVEMPGLLPRQALRSWLHTGPDRAYVVHQIVNNRDVPVFCSSSPTSFLLWQSCLDLGLWRSGASPTSGFPMGNTSA